MALFFLWKLKSSTRFRVICKSERVQEARTTIPMSPFVTPSFIPSYQPMVLNTVLEERFKVLYPFTFITHLLEPKSLDPW